MGKFAAGNGRYKTVSHPFLGRKDEGYGAAFLYGKRMVLPSSFRFYGNEAEREKWKRTVRWTKDLSLEFRPGNGYTVVDAFAGAGVLVTFYQSFGFRVLAIEKDRFLASALLLNLLGLPKRHEMSPEKLRLLAWKHDVHLADNLAVLASIASDRSDVCLIDLDAYGSCVPQIHEAVRVLKNGHLFVTSGDIYAGYRFKTWKFTQNRYGVEFSGPPEDFPAGVLFPSVQKEAVIFGKRAELVDWFVYPTITRVNIKIHL